MVNVGRREFAWNQHPPCPWGQSANQEAILDSFKYVVFIVFLWHLSTLRTCWDVHSPAGLSWIAFRGSCTGVTPLHPARNVDEGQSFLTAPFWSPRACIFRKECVVCQFHFHLSLDNLLTSRILECQPGCLYNCCLCQSLCEKCHQENEVRKRSCKLFLRKVTTTESITCFQDSFENIPSSWKKRLL